MTEPAAKPTPSVSTSSSAAPTRPAASLAQPATAPAQSAAAPAATRKSHRLKPATRAKISYTVFVLAWTAFSVVASQYLIALPMAWLLGADVEKPFWTLIYYILYNSFALALIIFAPRKIADNYRRRKTAQSSAQSVATDPLFTTNTEELGLKGWPTLVDIGLAPIAYVAYAILAGIIINFFSLFSWFNADQEQDVGFNYFLTSGDRLMAMIAIVFIAPIAEEVIMRGYLYGKLRNKYKIPLAILLTSVIFAVLHGQLNVGVTVFVLSCVLCGLREITGTIWSGMLLHMLSNGIAFYLLYCMA